MATFVPARYPDAGLIAGTPYTRINVDIHEIGVPSCDHADNSEANPPWSRPEICKMAGNIPFCIQAKTELMSSYTAAAVSLWNGLPTSATCGGFTKIADIDRRYCNAVATVANTYATTTAASDAANTAQPLRRIFKNG